MTQEEINTFIAARHVFGWNSYNQLKSKSKGELALTLNHYCPNMFRIAGLEKRDIVHILKNLQSDHLIKHQDGLNLISPADGSNYRGKPLDSITISAEERTYFETVIQKNKSEQLYELNWVAVHRIDLEREAARAIEHQDAIRFELEAQAHRLVAGNNTSFIEMCAFWFG
jgi:hypothetical protein